MIRFVTGWLLLPVCLLGQVVSIVPMFVMLLVTHLALLAREIRMAKRDHRPAHPFRRWYNFYIKDDEWMGELFILFFPLLIWMAYTFPKLRMFE